MRNLLGKAHMTSLFPEMLALVPSIGAQQALLKAFEHQGGQLLNTNAAGKAQGGPWQKTVNNVICFELNNTLSSAAVAICRLYTETWPVVDMQHVHASAPDERLQQTHAHAYGRRFLPHTWLITCCLCAYLKQLCLPHEREC